MGIDVCGRSFESLDEAEDFIKTTNFNKWWIESKFVSTIALRVLLYKYCMDHFIIWFNKNDVDWNEESMLLCIFAYAHFDLWWDKKSFNYDKGLFFLSKNCSEHFDKWIYKGIKLKRESTRLGVSRFKMNLHQNAFKKFNNWARKTNLYKKLKTTHS